MVAIFGNKNRRLETSEAVAEGVKNLQKEANDAIAFAQKAQQLGNFPSKEEEAAAAEDIKYAIRCLEEALAAAKSVQRNLK